MSRRRGRQHLKRRDRMVARAFGCDLVELRVGDAIRGGTLLFDGPLGRFFVFADYSNNKKFAGSFGVEFEGCDHVGQF